MYSVGIDIGGTFTDFTLYDSASGAVHVDKRLTTPHAPERAVLEGLAALRRHATRLSADAVRLNHATTLVTNAILERKGAATALVTTAGFRDVLETRLEYRYNVYDLFIRYPEPIVPRRLRFGVTERVMSDGAVRTPLAEGELAALAHAIRAAGIEAVAIVFLHAYRNPEHERRAAAILRAKLPGVAISVSHLVNPEPREYQRSSTTVLDAYVKPLVDRYLSGLEGGLREQGFRAGLEIMLSNGGSATAAIARDYPIQMIESGPAAGVEAAIWMCRQFGIEDALSFDMGGTTAKLCILRGGLADRARKFEAARVHRFVSGSGLPVAVPVYDLIEIGAGGGSIARVDHLGLVSVGPDSAGADPGPACYGSGGTEPTVTDADVVLGHIDPGYFLGGTMQLDAEAARRAVGARIGAALGVGASEAAHGIYDIVNETMAAAARLHIAEKGCDPAKLTLIAFGGAGPLHAVELARKLGCPRLLFPPYAGVMSSFGLLTAPPAFERMATVKRPLLEMDRAALEALLARLRGEVDAILGADGEREYRYVAEMWHRGQEYPIEIPFDRVTVESGGAAALAERFAARYRELYGRTDDENPIELAALRAIGTRPAQSVTKVAWSVAAAAAELPPRDVYDPATRTYARVPVIARSRMKPGETLDGPLIVQDPESGAVIRAGDRLEAREHGALMVHLRLESAGE